MKKNIVLMTLVILASNPITAAAMGEKERKKIASKKTFEKEPLTIVQEGRASFVLKGKKVGPFNFKGITPSDSGAIFATKKTGASNIAVGIVHNEKTDKDKLFALKFDKKWENPEFLFERQLEGFGFKPGSGFLKLKDDEIVAAGVYPDGLGVSVYHFNFGGKELDHPQAQEMDRLVSQVGGVAHIKSIAFKKSKNPMKFIAQITYVLENGEEKTGGFSLSRMTPREEEGVTYISQFSND